MEREILTHIIAVQDNIAITWRGGTTFGVHELNNGLWTDVDCFTYMNGVKDLHEAELYAHNHFLNVLGYEVEEVE